MNQAFIKMQCPLLLCSEYLRCPIFLVCWWHQCGRPIIMVGRCHQYRYSVINLHKSSPTLGHQQHYNRCRTWNGRLWKKIEIQFAFWFVWNKDENIRSSKSSFCDNSLLISAQQPEMDHRKRREFRRSEWSLRVNLNLLKNFFKKFS